MANSGAVDLLARLQRVAAVDEQHRALHQHDRGAGRAGEAGEPGEPLLARRHVFVLVAVGARHDEAGQSAARQLGAQRRDARRARRALGAIVERLEPGLEHGGHLYGASGGRQCPTAWLSPVFGMQAMLRQRAWGGTGRRTLPAHDQRRPTLEPDAALEHQPARAIAGERRGCLSPAAAPRARRVRSVRRAAPSASRAARAARAGYWRGSDRRRPRAGNRCAPRPAARMTST